MDYLTILTVGKAVLVTAAFVSWRSKRSVFGPISTVLGLQLLLGMVTEVIASWLCVERVNNLWLYNAYIPLEFIAVLFMCHRELKLERFGWITPVLLAIYVGVLAYELPEALEKERFISLTFQSGAAILSLLLLLHLVRSAYTLEGENHFSRPITYVLLGQLFFFSGAIPVLGLINAMSAENSSLANALYSINDVLFAVRYGAVLFAPLLAVSFIQRSTR